ncbi:VIT domain-containing protein [Nitrospirillum bahiense]|uniref:Vault protein inter-alpha-trypsin-like protein n=1 Tax=Nitrospirillum amazonense TaxID=28077 RepID=A0A560GA16_9PROT|nr:VIT domain-containing protein [Nitrospirillum amazonense]TWB30651.1 vault protein inter-alpha-trypsin-like protein [Nitrospirillum amazonense]
MRDRLIGRWGMGRAVWVLLTLAVFLGLLFWARTGGATPAPARSYSPELVARNYMAPGGAQPTHALTIGNLDITVKIIGGVAHTTLSATFANPTTAAVEGDFTLDLPAGSVVTGYALDVNGQMADGVLVAKRAATLAYQKQVRRGVDPGLAEVTRDNAFRTHVFPIFPNRGRTVRVEFATPIGTDQPYTLPLVTLDPVAKVNLLVIDVDAAAAPALAGPDGLDLRWAPGTGGLEARANASGVTLGGALTIGGMPPAAPVVLTRHHAGDTFFEVNAAVPGGTGGAKPTGRVRVYWDRSLSRQDAAPAELELLQRYLAAVGPKVVDVVLFADDTPHVLSFDSATAADEAVGALRAVSYGGATSLQGVLKAAPAPADACLYFSDGRVTLDAYQAERVNCPLFTLSSGADADHGFLAALVRKSGGEHLDLRARGADAVLARLSSPASRAIDVKAADGTALDFTVLPAAPDWVRIVGRAPPSLGAVKVTLADGRVLSFDLNDLPTAADDALGALWAADRVAEMTASDRPDQKAAVGFARRYGVAGGGAVFLVLERLQDYVDADIAPPDSLGKDLQNQFAAAQARAQQIKDIAAANRLGQVVTAWQEQKDWWAGRKPAPPPAVPPPPAPSRREPPPPHVIMNSTTVRPPPMPAPPPPIVGSVNTAKPPMVAPPMAAPVMAPPPPPQAVQPPAFAPPVEVNIEAPPPPVMAPLSSVGPTPRAPIAGRAADQVVVTGSRANGQSGGGQSGGDSAGAIEVAPWDPNRPYIREIKEHLADAEEFRAAVTAQAARYGSLPAFYLDVAELLFRNGKVGEAASMALSALELPSADTGTLIIVADDLMRFGQEARAIWLYEKVLYLDGDRPQPRRSLALALIERAERAAKHGAPAASVRADYERAMRLLNEVITRTWSPAYTGIEMVALMEANRILPRLEKLGVRDIPLDPRLRDKLDVDLRVVLEWNVDATDMDLWVDEPSGERAIYSHPRTAIGGRLSHDMTQGYGPEEYLLRRAPNGEYTISANIYRTDRLNPNGPITVRAHLYRNYQRATEEVQMMQIELKPGEDGTRVVGRVTVGGGAAASDGASRGP